MQYSGIILDVDGTIWNTTDVTASAWNNAIDDCHVNVPYVTGDILKTQFGKTMDVIADNLFSGIDKDKRSLLLEKCCEYEHKAVQENEKEIIYPEVFETVRDLSSIIPFYVVSNCQNGYIELTLTKTGMTNFITDIECFGHTGKTKAENIKLLVNRNNIIHPVYIGDTQGDCDECRKAEVPFIWAAYGFGKNVKGVNQKINTFGELRNILLEK